MRRYRTPEDRRPDVSKYKRPEIPAEAAEIAKVALRKWCDKNLSPAQIKEAVHRRLNDQRDKVLLGVLGLRDSFGKLELDPHSSSPLKGAMAKALNEAAEVWVAENCSDLPRLANSVVADLRKHYLKTYQDRLRSILSAVAEEQAEIIAKEIVEGQLAPNCDEPIKTSTQPTWKFIDHEAKHTIVEEAEVLGLVAVAEGVIYDEGYEAPHSEVGYLVALLNRTFHIRAHIVVSAGQWMPVNSEGEPFTNDDENKTISCQIGGFPTEKLKLFELMTAADFAVVEQAITAWNEQRFGAEQIETE